MSAGVSPVPDEAVEATRAIAAVLATWGVRSRHGEWTDAETQHRAARDALAAALPFLREGIAAEVLRPVRELAEVQTWIHDSEGAHDIVYRDDLRAALSAPVQAAEPEPEPVHEAVEVARSATDLAVRYGVALTAIAGHLADGTHGGIMRARLVIAELDDTQAAEEAGGE